MLGTSVRLRTTATQWNVPGRYGPCGKLFLFLLKKEPMVLRELVRFGPSIRPRRHCLKSHSKQKASRSQDRILTTRLAPFFFLDPIFAAGVTLVTIQPKLHVKLGRQARRKKFNIQRRVWLTFQRVCGYGGNEGNEAAYYPPIAVALDHDFLLLCIDSFFQSSA